MPEPLSAAESARIDQLAAVFARIGEERMKDLGLYNHALRVEAVGFRPWRDERGGRWLAGILVTPWFMNFLLLPSEPGQLAGAAVGERRRMELPCGEVSFTVGEVEEVGSYLANSLHSPMGGFKEHATASTTAWAAVEQFFVPPADQPRASCGGH